MQVFFAEFCGRRGCSWQEGILTVLLTSKLGIVIILGTIILILELLSLPILLIISALMNIIPKRYIKSNQPPNSDKLTRRIEFTIKGLEVVSRWRHKSTNKII
ncbi:hypothetical protein AMR41_08840 [Hapalosiphon sp. MRB220]|nr:hypothetical protein AMR41_08840 [Hapalosiphon sp. MRB220]